MLIIKKDVNLNDLTKVGFIVDSYGDYLYFSKERHVKSIPVVRVNYDTREIRFKTDGEWREIPKILFSLIDNGECEIK